MAQLVGVSAINQKVESSPPGQGTCLGCSAGLVPGQGTYERQLIDVSLSHRCFPLSLPFPLSKIDKRVRRCEGRKEGRKESTVDIDLCSTPEKGEMWPKASAETVAGVWLRGQNLHQSGMKDRQEGKCNTQGCSEQEHLCSGGSSTHVCTGVHSGEEGLAQHPARLGPQHRWVL